MDVRAVRRLIAEPALLLLSAKIESPQAMVMQLAVGLQESRFKSRRQLITKIINGVKNLESECSATSFWQMDRAAGVRAELCRKWTANYAAELEVIQ